jgi:uncharacterized protein YlbG (UPF0298 family)
MKRPFNNEDDGVREFRGTWAPAELHYLVEDGTITCTEAWLLQTIDSYVNCRGAGCYQTNERLAAAIHVDVRWLQKVLAKLRKLGLIRVVKTHPRRVMETKYSRVYHKKLKDGPKNRSLGGGL